MLSIGGIVCIINMAVIQFLKNRLAARPEPWDESELHPFKEDLDRELKDFRSAIEDNMAEVRKERVLLEKARGELESLRQECRQYLKKLEDIMEKGLEVRHEPESLSLTQPENDRRYEKMHSLLRQGLSLETVAQRLQMGMGEARLRLALSEKEESGYENRP